MKNFKITYTDYDNNEEIKSVTVMAETIEEAEINSFYEIDEIVEISMPQYQLFIEHIAGTAHGELKVSYCYAETHYGAVRMMEQLANKMSMTPNMDAFKDASERVTIYHSGVKIQHMGFMGALRSGEVLPITFTVPASASF